MKPNLAAVVAAAENDVIGRQGGLPWDVPEDLRWFKRLTLDHVVVCGRRTHEGIMDRLGGPLPRRHTVLLSSTATPPTDHPGILVERTLPDALNRATALTERLGLEEVFVIGGETLYRQTRDMLTRVYLTRVHAQPAGDARLPEGWLDPFRLQASQPVTDGGDVHTQPSHTREIYERA